MVFTKKLSIVGAIWWKKGQKMGMDKSPLPILGQCPKENNFFIDIFPIRDESFSFLSETGETFQPSYITHVYRKIKDNKFVPNNDQKNSAYIYKYQ